MHVENFDLMLLGLDLMRAHISKENSENNVHVILNWSFTFFLCQKIQVRINKET